MKQWTTVSMALAVLVSPGGIALAQDQENPGEVYLDEEYEAGRDWAIGLGFGLVDVGENVIPGLNVASPDEIEQYFQLNLRIPFGDRHANRGSNRSGFRGYLEPELGYWEGDFNSDFLVGINIIGGVPFNAVEFFVGGGIAVHFLDTDLQGFGAAQSGSSDDAIGMNAQFGVDVSVNQKVSFFATSRFDLVDDGRDDLESKATIGLRFHF